MTTTKEILRAEVLASRQALSQEVSASKSVAIALRVIGESWFKDAETIGLYSPHKGEVDPATIFEECFTRGKVAAYPRVDAKQLIFHEVEDLDDLEPGAFGIMEPADTSSGQAPGDTIAAKDLDIVFVPGIAFDETGNRIGFGHGYYDRFLPEMREDALIVGLAFACQMVKAVPRDQHDLPMHKIVTEELEFKCPPSASYKTEG